jgi:hypothetical protein
MSTMLLRKVAKRKATRRRIAKLKLMRERP